jgi:hypothetical protein
MLMSVDVSCASAGTWRTNLAIHEAWKQCAPPRRETSAGALRTPSTGELASGEHPEPAADSRNVADHAAPRFQHAQRRYDVATS